MKKRIFTGCATALITPFTADGKEVDYEAFEKLLDYQIIRGINAVVVAGTTGESPVLSSEEKRELFSLARSDTSSSGIPVIAGTGSNDTQQAVRKANEAEKQGVDGLLIVTPYYNKCSQDGLIKHYYYIADRVSTPIIVYNVPSRTGMNIKAETYKALSEHHNIYAVKEASSNLDEFEKSISDKECDLCFYSGNDDLTLPLMSLGAEGVISVVSNLIPEEMTTLCSYCIDGDFKSARVIHNKYYNLMKAMFSDVNPIPIKTACSEFYNISETLRLPLCNMPQEKSDKIHKLLQSYNLIM